MLEIVLNHQGAYLQADLLQQSPPLIVLQHSHLLDGNLVELDQSFALWQLLVDEEGVEIFHVGEADDLVDGCIVTNVSFLLGVGFAPLFGGHAKHGYVEHVCLMGIDDACLLRGHFFGNDVALDGVCMYAVVDFGQFTSGRPSDLPLLFLLKTLEFLDDVYFELGTYLHCELKCNIFMSVCAAITSRLSL